MAEDVAQIEGLVDYSGVPALRQALQQMQCKVAVGAAYVVEEFDCRVH